MVLRPQLRLATYRQSRHTLKEVRRGLGAIRDLAVNAEELARATRQAGLSRQSIRTTVGSWTHEHRKAATKTAFSPMTAALATVRQALLVEPPRPGRHVLRDGLRRLYRRAAVSCRRALADPRAHQLHECRQRTQRLRYALEFANPWLSERDRKLWHQTKTLSTRLGHHRDLCRLDSLICRLPFRPSHRRQLHAELKKRQAVSLRTSISCAGRAYSKKRRQFKSQKSCRSRNDGIEITSARRLPLNYTPSRRRSSVGRATDL